MVADPVRKFMHNLGKDEKCNLKAVAARPHCVFDKRTVEIDALRTLRIKHSINIEFMELFAFGINVWVCFNFYDW
jgi:hypothetical protein